jgi:hypothetical protein
MGPKKVFKRGYPTGKTVGVEGSEKGVRMPKLKSVVASRNRDLLTLHGVADGSQIYQILHSKEKSDLDSIIDQEAFLVTNDFKVVDIKANQWPIDLDKAEDVRTVLGTYVKRGELLGKVMGYTGECAMVESLAGTEFVAIKDLEPIMAEATPQEDVQQVFDVMAPEGVIHLVEEKGIIKAKTENDAALLKGAGFPEWFEATQYDIVLGAMSKLGYSLETESEIDSHKEE